VNIFRLNLIILAAKLLQQICQTMFLHRTLNFIIFFFGLVFLLPAQNPFFKVLVLPGDLRECTINVAVQDNDGFIMLGTSCGLVKFDGLEFDLIGGGLLTTSENHAISSLFQDKDGKVWVGYKSGELAILEGNKFTSFNPPGKINGFEITDILSDSAGRMWFSAYGHGVCYGSGDSIIHLGEGEGLPDQYIYDLVSDQNGNIWAGSDAGISIIDLSSGKPRIQTLTPEDGLPDMMMQVLVADESGRIWAGSHDNGFCLLESNTRQILQKSDLESWNYGPVSGIVPSRDLLWISTKGSGLLLFDKRGQGIARKFEAFDGLSLPRLDGIFSDNQGNLWLFGGNMLIMIPGNYFEYVKSGEQQVYSDVHALMVDRESFIWYATSEGLFRHESFFDDYAKPQKIALPKIISPRNITCLFEDHNSYLWIGTYGEGLYRLDPDYSSGQFITEKDGLINNNVLSIAATKNHFWFATLGGASRYNYSKGIKVHRANFESFDEKKGLGNNFIYCVYADTKGRVWFATDGTGVTLYQNDKFYHFTTDQGLSSERVYTITEDKKGLIWCATHDNKIFYFEGNGFVELEAWKENAYTISALVADTNNNLLIVHENGIALYNQHNQTIQSFGPESGIYPINPEFNSVAASQTGNIWIGTESGLIKYNPQPANYRLQPKVLIKNVSIFLEPINPAERQEFSWNENHFTFDYIGLWYRAPEKVKYQIILEGYDIEWITTNDLSSTYSNLPPGKYTFKIRASQNQSFENNNVATYSFTIRAPFWLNWWFYLVIIILFGILIYTIIRRRTQRMKRAEEVKKEKIIFQFETLKSQINPHFLFNSFSTLISAIDEDKEMAIEYVERLSVFFRNILELRDKDLILMAEELELVENYVFLQKKRYGENLLVHIDIDEESTTTMIPPLTLQLLLENAVKHNVISGANPLTIKIKSDKGFIRVSNKLKRKPFVGDSTGFGLKTIQHRYLLFSKHKVKVMEENGFFIVSLPVIR